MSYCTLKTLVRNNKGEIVDSILYKLLEELLGEEQAGDIYYQVATNPLWLGTLGYYEKDANGEITLKSLLRHSGLDKVETKKIVNQLNKEIQSGEYNYDIAQEKVRQFNTESPFSDEYLATMEYVPSSGKYNVHIVERTVDNEAALNRTLRHSSGFRVIMDKLRKLGVNVDFVKPGEILGNGVYNTQQYEKTKRGLLSLIKIATAENPEDIKTMELALAEEAAHFLVGCMSNEPIYGRFLDWLMNPEHSASISEYVKKEYNTELKLDVEDARELMADVIAVRLNKGKVANNPIERFITKLFKRINQMWHRAALMFSKHGSYAEHYHRVKGDIAQAEIWADEIAAQLLGEKITEEQKLTALELKEIKHNAELPIEMAAYRKTLATIKNFLLETAKITSSKLSAEATEIGETVERYATINRGDLLSNESFDIFSRQRAVEGITSAMLKILQYQSKFVKILNSVDPVTEGFTAHMLENSQKLVMCRAYVRECTRLCWIVDYFASNKLDFDLRNIQLTDSFGNTKSFDLLDIRDSIYANVGITPSKTFNITGKLNAHKGPTMLLSLVGKERLFVQELIYNQTGLRKIPGIKARGFASTELIDVGGNTIENILTCMELDNNWFDAWIKSAALNKDIPIQLADRIMRLSKNLANKRTINSLNYLQSLKKEFKKNGIYDTIIFFEENPNSKDEARFSGNFIQPLKYGEWEAKRHEFYTTKRNKFFKDYKALHPLADENLIALKCGIHMHNEMKKWHKENSENNPNYGKPNHMMGNMKYIPKASLYMNEQYYKTICEDEKEIAQKLGISEAEASKYAERNKKLKRELSLNKLMEFKADCDYLIGDEASPFYRAPQYRGIMGRRIKARQGKTKTKKAIGSIIAESAILTNDDRDFGGMSDFDTLEDDPAKNKLDFEYSKATRLPLYGVHKLREMKNLDTDLFTTLLSYSNMANHYAGLKGTSTALSVLALVSGDRTVQKFGKDSTLDKETAENTKVHKRLIKHIEKNVYGISYFGPGSGYFERTTKKKIKKEDGEDGEVVEVAYKRRFMFAKLANLLNSLARTIYLGGNVHSAAINVGTGIFEIYKEAIAGEHFTGKEFAKAFGQYLMLCTAAAPDMLANEMDKYNKLSLLTKLFDVLGSVEELFRGWNTTRNRVKRFMVEDFLMQPYKTGDHLMQVVPFLAMMMHEKVYQKMKDGSIKEISLLDAYEIDKETTYTNRKGEQNEVSVKQLKLKNGIYKTKNAEEIDKIEKIEELRKKIIEYEKAIKQNKNQPLSASIDVTPYVSILEDDDFWAQKDEDGKIQHLPKRNYNSLKDLSNLKNTIQTRIDAAMWNKLDESNFTAKFRTVTNNMHGVYNKIDKSMLTLNIYGNMLATMKGYVFGMVTRRFSGMMQGPSYNLNLMHDFEGSLTTFLKVLSNVGKNYDGDGWQGLKSFGNTLAYVLLPALPFAQKKVEQSMKALGYSDNQYRNMRRNIMDVFVGSLLLFCTSLFKKPPKEDGETKEDYEARLSWWHAMCYYATMRLLSEQTAFNWPMEISYEFKQSAELVPTGFSAAWTVAKTFGYSFIAAYDWLNKENIPEKEYQKDFDKFYKGWMKVLPYTKEDPFVHPDLPILPYKATDSYFFNRKK